MQVCLYSWMYGLTDPNKSIQPGIYYMKSLFSDAFDSAVYQKPAKDKVSLSEFGSIRDSFEEELGKCLREIFDYTIPFQQTETENACMYCAFTGICGK